MGDPIMEQAILVSCWLVVCYYMWKKNTVFLACLWKVLAIKHLETLRPEDVGGKIQYVMFPHIIEQEKAKIIENRELRLIEVISAPIDYLFFYLVRREKTIRFYESLIINDVKHWFSEINIEVVTVSAKELLEKQNANNGTTPT